MLMLPASASLRSSSASVPLPSATSRRSGRLTMVKSSACHSTRAAAARSRLVRRARERALRGEAARAAREREFVEHDRAVGEPRAQRAVLAGARRTAAGRSAARRRVMRAVEDRVARACRAPLTSTLRAAVHDGQRADPRLQRPQRREVGGDAVAVNGASVVDASRHAAGRERCASRRRVPARAERKRADAASASSAKRADSSSTRDAEREVGRIERRALGARTSRRFRAARRTCRSGAAWRRATSRRRPPASTRNGSGEPARRAARGHRHAGERALRCHAALVDREVRDRRRGRRRPRRAASRRRRSGRARSSSARGRRRARARRCRGWRASRRVPVHARLDARRSARFTSREAAGHRHRRDRSRRRSRRAIPVCCASVPSTDAFTVASVALRQRARASPQTSSLTARAASAIGPAGPRPGADRAP